MARCSSLVALAAAAEAGTGLVVLPTSFAAFHPGLVEVRRIEAIPDVPVWLTLHEDLRADPRVRAVADAVVAGMGPILS